MKYLAAWLVLLVACCVVLGFTGRAHAQPARTVTLYTSVDEPVFAPIVKAFETQTGIRVRCVTDTEATKTAGLAERLEAEKDHPRADVYWGNEPFHTINLTDAGLFAPYRPANTDDIPARWRDAQNRWTAVGLRARMLAFSTAPRHRALVAGIATVQDLGRPELAGKIGVCHPAFGTASGQFAALYLVLGEEAYVHWLHDLKVNRVVLLGGNSVVAEQIAAGNLAAGLTDNDDIENAKADGQPINGVAPNQSDIGTLVLPTTVSLLSNAPNPESGKALIDYLCRPDVEQKMIQARYLAASVRGELAIKAMSVDYADTARHMRTAVELALKVLQDRK